ncbi:hypothetical protein J2W40_003546 [Sphingobium xenophagum]|uniref:Uncharacterized protein n=1 Tax=Sphingobium xenophagum TaxID=121428 RepID=A0ABU1X570_SPHXE|nr:hypothetical protein [Sphingobium xenophagum]
MFGKTQGDALAPSWFEAMDGNGNAHARLDANRI